MNTSGRKLLQRRTNYGLDLKFSELKNFFFKHAKCDECNKVRAKCMTKTCRDFFYNKSLDYFALQRGFLTLNGTQPTIDALFVEKAEHDLNNFLAFLNHYNSYKRCKKAPNRLIQTTK